MSTGIPLPAVVGERVSLSVERVKEGARWRERRGHEDGFVAPSSKCVSNQRAQFNEAAFLVFSYPPVPVSPNGSPLSLPSSSISSYSSALCVLAFALICPFHICSLLFHLWRLTFSLRPPPPSTAWLASNISVFLSLQGGLSHRGWHSQRRFRLWVCRGDTAV